MPNCPVYDRALADAGTDAQVAFYQRRQQAQCALGIDCFLRIRSMGVNLWRWRQPPSLLRPREMMEEGELLPKRGCIRPFEAGTAEHSHMR